MKRLLLLVSLLSLAALSVPVATAAPGGKPAAGRKRPANAGPTLVTSDKLEFDYKNNVALFDGRVNVKDPEFTLKADRMIIFLEKTNDVQRVTCTGNVRMTSDDIVIVCGKATYTRLNAHVLLEDEPVVTKGGQRLTGQSIDVWLDDSRVVVNNGVGIEARTDSFKETRKLPK
ncbi:MAG: hypothetical protein IJV65_00520 [Kiritimatiellae bacterium]|nr:hypothetical protein [Kiritimatiellia bacterium]